MRLEEKIANRLLTSRKSLAIAESCTGGLLSHRLTSISGSSSYFKLGIVTYCNESKAKLLKVSVKTLQKYGAVSRPTAIAMAKGVRKIHKTDFGIAITGIAGPTGATSKKPIGLTFIAVNTPSETLCVEYHLCGNRKSIKTQASTQAMTLLMEFLP